MERAEWLKQMRSMAEGLYDRISPEYWIKLGLVANETHQAYLQKFLARVNPGGTILSAACGAGRYDGLLLEAGHSVVGVDQSAGMLAVAKEHFPEARYEKMGLQEIHFREAFDGAICMDAMEHICPEDWPGIMGNFQRALKPGAMLYFTVEEEAPEEIEAAYERAKAMGLPVVAGEIADEVEAAYRRANAIKPPTPLPIEAMTVYHYYPSREQVRAWLEQAGMTVEEEGSGNGYHHYLVRRE